MLGFLVRRVARGCCVLFLVSVLCFCAFEIAPGDFFVEARVTSTISPEAIDRLREQHGLTRSLPVKYVYWAASVVRGEWGESLMYGTPVWPILWTRAKNTLILSVTAMSAAWIVAIPLCLRAGTGGRRVHGLVFGFAAFFNAIPEILIVVLFLICALRAGLLHLGGITPLPATGSIWESAGGLTAQLALPVLALMLAALPQLLAHGMSAVTEAADSPVIRAARTNGISGTRLRYSYLLRLAANPLISLFGLSIGALLSSSLIVESVLAWPGLGRLLLEATMQRDVYVVLGAVILSSAFVVGGNLISDILLYLADPRIRHV